MKKLTMKEFAEIKELSEAKAHSVSGCRLRRKAVNDHMVAEITDGCKEYAGEPIEYIVFCENMNLGTKKYPWIFKEVNIETYSGVETKLSYKTTWGKWVPKSKVFAVIVKEAE